MSPLDLNRLHDRLSDCLFDRVIPFWLEHAIDPAGGLNTCLTDEGQLVSRDKWLWSQWRAVWVFSRLYRRTRESHYLALAHRIVRFCCAHGWSGEGWRLCVAADGTSLRGCESIYVDGFAIYGLAEFARATDDTDARIWLKRTVTAVMRTLQQPHDRIPHYPYPIPAGIRVHGIPMIFSLCFLEAADQFPDHACLPVARALSDEVFATFFRADRNLILERVNADGSEAPAPLGTAVVPGHAIESMWFQIHVAEALKDRKRIDQSIAQIRRHLEIGWDDDYGGLLLAVDANGAADVGWTFADYKLWWPHTEAMYALLRAYELSGEAWCLEWYAKVEAYSFAHFPHPTAGEWVQRLRRNGEKTTEKVALPVKDPFHLPRALLLCLESIERMRGQPLELAHTQRLDGASQSGSPCVILPGGDYSVISSAMRSSIDAGDISGCVTVVVAKDRILHLAADGLANIERREPMRFDSLFWIASMTKPVTGVALMMLQDKGKLNVLDPVAKYIPAFAELKAPSGKRANLTISQMMTHISGLGEADADEAGKSKTLADLIPLYLVMPMQYEPGERWKYTQSGINTGARVVEVVSGMSFDAFLQKRLFDPLGMTSTTFYPHRIPNAHRVTGYRKNITSGALEAETLSGGFGVEAHAPLGHGGLFSTGPDYARFCQMLLNEGTLDGKRYLSPEAMKYLTTVQTGDLPCGFLQTAECGNRGENYGWGLGTCILRTPHEGVAAMLSPGTFGHGGAWGTQAWMDPVRGVAYILMVQRPGGPNGDTSELRRVFQHAAANQLRFGS